MIKVIFIVMAVLALTGCATSEFGKASSGGAVYEYSKTVAPDGTKACTARVTSSREVAGATIRIGDNCTLDTSVEQATSPFEVIEKVLDMVPRK